MSIIIIIIIIIIWFEAIYTVHEAHDSKCDLRPKVWKYLTYWAQLYPQNQVLY